MPKLNKERSQEIAKQTNPLPNQCWKNSVLAVIQLQDHKLVYVEGHVAISGIPTEHGWIVEGDDILDVTLYDDEHVTGYYEAARYTLSYLMDGIVGRKLPLTPRQDLHDSMMNLLRDLLKE